MGEKQEWKLDIDPRKHKFFLHTGYHQLPGEWTPETIFNHRLKEARLQFQYAKYDERFPPESYPRLLCLGAGTGAEVLAAMEYGYKAIGIGLLGEEQVNYARSRGVDFRVMDMHDLKFPNKRFDAVYANASVEHCVNPWLVCAEVYATLRDHGLWWMTLDPYQEGCPGADGPKNHHYMILPQWFMCPMFRRSGFRVLYIEDSNLRYQYLVEKLPIEDVPKEQKRNLSNSIFQVLIYRMKLGEEYSNLNSG